MPEWLKIALVVWTLLMLAPLLLLVSMLMPANKVAD